MNNTIKQLKKNYWERFSSKMEHDLYGGQKKVWNMLRTRKKPINEQVRNTKMTPEEWILHYENLYGQPDEHNRGQEVMINIEDNGTEMITLQEVQAGIRWLKNRKALGIDKIANKMIKYGGINVEKEIMKLY